MKYLTPQLKNKLTGNLGVSYVIAGDEGYEKDKHKLLAGDITPQNDLIDLDFGSDDVRTITVNSDELRALAEELVSWADIMDETLYKK